MKRDGEKKKSTFRLMLKCFSYCKGQIIVFSLIMLLISALRVAPNVLQKSIVNTLLQCVSSKEFNTKLLILILSYIVLMFIDKAAGFLHVLALNLIKLRSDLIFKKLFMFKTSKTPQEKFFDTEFMQKFVFVNNNIEKSSGYITNILTLIFYNLSKLIFIFIVFGKYMPVLFIYVAIISIIYSVVGYVIAKKRYLLSKKQIYSERYANYYGSLLIDRENAKELRVFNLKSNFLNKWKGFYEKLKDERVNISLKNINISKFAEIVTFILKTAVSFMLLLWTFYGKIDLGTFVMLFGVVAECNGTIKQVVDGIVEGTYSDVIYIRDFADFVNPVAKEEWDQIKNLNVDDGKLPYGEFKELELKNVSFKYPNGEKKAVDNVSFKLKKGEIVSVLGYNGSGKTTLSKLLTGMMAPSSGEVLLNGKNIDGENKFQVFKYFGIAFQEYAKYVLSLKENVAMGRVEKMEDKDGIIKAYEKGNLIELINKLSKKDETILGKDYDDEGTDLSGGEWQRIILSRAYMGEPEVIIMDEPTASIDPLEEMHLLQHFRKVLNGKSAILISHRIGFARLADRIIMMEDGVISEEGTHEELLEKNGYYAALFNAQKNLYFEEVAK